MSWLRRGMIAAGHTYLHPYMSPTVHTPLLLLLLLLLTCATHHRQERIESSGPLGSAPSSNPHLDVVGSELAAAAAQGLSDGFTAYLAALLEIER